MPSLLHLLEGSTRSSAKESGDGVWEQIKSVWRIFSSLRWEVGAVRRSKGTAAGSQHRNCCRYRRWEMEGGWEGLLHVHSTGSPTSSGGVGGRASLWIKLNPPLCRTIETGRACKKIKKKKRGYYKFKLKREISL